ncbi:MAG: DUF1738 domain-containing protein [Bdellovibrionales bacterium]|nr:DUF1738 domain-containing protein [Bdellovibrionales bacterium]
MKNKQTVYEIITERIIDKLKEGVVPWHRPWKGGELGLPRNAATGRAYRGVNVWLLHCQGFDSNLWLTYKQIKKFPGAWTLCGEKATPVTYWNWYEKEDPENPDKKLKIPCLKYYRVWNVCQVGGLPDKFESVEEELPQVFNSIENAENITNKYKDRPLIKYDGRRAFYRPATDSITMPNKERFESSEEFYSTLFHELTHSTGHEQRLNRKGISETHYFGDSVYSQEELVAEMGAAYLSGLAGIEEITLDNSASYINGWLRKLTNNPKWVVIAAAQAQKAVDYILSPNVESEA